MRKRKEHADLNYGLARVQNGNLRRVHRAGRYDPGFRWHASQWDYEVLQLPNDVAAIVRLLNLIDDAEGGISSTQLTASASPGQIFRAIRHFQQTQNDLGCLPKLSVDGHVDRRSRG
jgi:hypothetical protein